MFIRKLRAGLRPVPVSLFVVVSCAPLAARADVPASFEGQLAGEVDRATVVRAAVARSPGVRAATQRARATGVEATAQGRLPPPEVMGQVWQLPLDKPYAFASAQMVMVGVSQSIPAPGSLGAREEATGWSARAAEALAAERARLVARDADHAFADYLESTARHRVHLRHRDETARLFAAASARQAGGGSLMDVTQAEVELARVEADLATDGARVDTAKVRLNALLVRGPTAPLGAPVDGEAMVPAWTRETILAKARQARPELRAAGAETEARRLELRAADREATWPSFSVAALYFAPVDALPRHGAGANVTVSLPWIWGAADRRRDAQEGFASAAASNADAVRIQVDADVMTAEATVRSAALRLSVLRDRAQPASRRALDAAMAGYESARTDMLTVLNARRALIEIEMEVVAARAALDHALAELDAAVGVAVQRTPFGSLTEGGMRHG